MATGQVLLHRFYCKKSFARFNVKRAAASCVWLASKLEESPRKAMQVLIVFHRMECIRENLPIQHLDTCSKRYADLIRTERHVLKEMGFICHVEHPHKFISNYLADAPSILRQEAWNLANDSLRTTLCVRFKSEVVACGVVYAAARRLIQEPLPWWKADKTGIDEVCRVLAHLYTLPKAQYLTGSFANSNRTPRDSPHQSVSKDGLPVTTGTGKGVSQDSGKDERTKASLEKSIESKRSDEESKNTIDGGETREKPESKLESGEERIKERERGRERTRSKRDRDQDRIKERGHHSTDKGRNDKSRHHSSRADRHYHSSSSYSSRHKKRVRHHY